MPIIKSAIKRVKQAAKRRDRNVGIKRDIKGATKTFLAKPTAENLSAAHSELDTAVKKKLLKKNTVARRKAQLAKVAKDAGVKLVATKKASTSTTTAAKVPVKKSTATKKSAAASTKTAKAPTATKKTTSKK